MKWLSRPSRFLTDLLLPAQCVGCQRELPTSALAARHLCQRCYATLGHWLKTGHCLRCRTARPDFGYCPRCQRRFRFSRLIIAGSYRHPVLKAIIQGFKYQWLKDLADPLADFLTPKIEARLPRSYRPAIRVVPIPADPKRLQIRGFNPAGLIAKKVARGLGLDMAEEILGKVKSGPAQMRIKNTQARWANARQAYQIINKAPPIKGERFLIIDDVMTTGATLNACAKLLIENGARSVWAAVAAAQVPES